MNMSFLQREVEREPREFEMMQAATTLAPAILKIAALISMMRQETTMTTEIQVASTPDISLSNNVLKLKGPSLPRVQLAAISWFTTKQPALEALQLILRSVHRRIKSALPEYTTWILVGNSAWQPDNRVVRHHKLWGALKAQNVEVPPPGRLAEEVVEAEGKLKFFGAALVSDLSIGLAARLLLNERCTYLAAVPDSFEVQQLLPVGWTGQLEQDLVLLDHLSACGGLLFKRMGEFDDLEKGVVAIGSSALIDRLLDPN